MSPAGASNENRNMKIAIPVFWTPVSTAMASTSFAGCRKASAVKNPPKYPSHGKPIPAAAIYKKKIIIFKL